MDTQIQAFADLGCRRSIVGGIASERNGSGERACSDVASRGSRDLHGMTWRGIALCVACNANHVPGQGCCVVPAAELDHFEAEYGPMG